MMPDEENNTVETVKTPVTAKLALTVGLLPQQLLIKLQPASKISSQIESDMSKLIFPSREICK